MNKPSIIPLCGDFSNRSNPVPFRFPDGGRIKASIHMGETEKKVYSGNDLNDNQWHSVKYQRRGKRVGLYLDEKLPVLGKSSF